VPCQIDPKKLESDLSQLSAENRVKRGSVTQRQAKRINEIAFRGCFRVQGVGGSNPLSPDQYCEFGPDRRAVPRIEDPEASRI